MTDKEVLYEFIKDTYNCQEVPQKIEQQIMRYVLENQYTYEGIYNALWYWYYVKQNDVSRAHGRISIVPYIYDEAQLWRKALDKVWMSMKDEPVQPAQEKEIVIQPPKRKPITRYSDNLYGFLEE